MTSTLMHTYEVLQYCQSSPSRSVLAVDLQHLRLRSFPPFTGKSLAGDAGNLVQSMFSATELWSFPSKMLCIEISNGF